MEKFDHEEADAMPAYPFVRVTNTCYLVAKGGGIVLALTPDGNDAAVIAPSESGQLVYWLYTFQDVLRST